MTMIAMGVGVFGGAVVTRLTGLGFALFATPFLILVMDPYAGVLLCNLLSLVVSVAMLATHWRRVDWRRASLLLAPAPAVIPLGALLARRLPTSHLSILIGVLLLVAILLVARGRPTPALAGTRGALIAGASSSALNVLAGVGGPALALYGASERWVGPGFVATMPVCAIAMNALSLATKGLPHLSGATLLVLPAALVAGSVSGEWVRRRFSGRHNYSALLILAAVGAVTAITRGIIA